MKKSILLYLFILAVLFNVFTYAYFSKDLKKNVMITWIKSYVIH
jgi:hypothetical protein